MADMNTTGNVPASTTETRRVYWIEGDGIGAEVWRATRPVLNSAVERAYGGARKLEWVELLAGHKAVAATGSPLPEETINALKGADLAMKGPLATPVGTGIRSLNVALRQIFDLYACIRPIRYFEGLRSPVKRPDLVNMVLFRENTEDVYMGIEFKDHSPEANRLIEFLRDELHIEGIRDGSSMGVKPISEYASKRLVRRAIAYAIKRGLPSVTLVHKGNIMKYTEGSFRQWGYDLAAEEFANETCVSKTPVEGKVAIKDCIADAMFQEALLHPANYSVLAAPNLNGDFLSDALAAQVGGLGMAPGVNMSDTLAFYEATHGIAPDIAGQDKANPCSLILCGVMLLEHIGWTEAANRVQNAVLKALSGRLVTADLANQMDGGITIGCRAFGDVIGALL